MARLFAGCCLLLLARAHAAGMPVFPLDENQGLIDAQPLAQAWLDEHGDATLAQVMRSADTTFQAPRPGEVQHLSAHGALWLHLRLARGAEARQDWMLKFPMPLLDYVTVYQQEQGQWRSDSAGDTVAVTTWPERGRYPFFRLALPHGETRDVFVRIQHATPANFPMELATESHHAQRVQLEYLALGLAFSEYATVR